MNPGSPKLLDYESSRVRYRFETVMPAQRAMRPTTSGLALVSSVEPSVSRTSVDTGFVIETRPCTSGLGERGLRDHENEVRPLHTSGSLLPPESVTSTGSGRLDAGLFRWCPRPSAARWRRRWRGRRRWRLPPGP